MRQDPDAVNELHDSAIVRALGAWVDLCQRRAGLTLLLTLIATAALGSLATRTLGFNVDPNALFSAELRFQRMIREFQQYFPVLTDSLLIVIDGESPELTRDAQERLTAALAARTDVYHRVFLPGEEPFFERNALLYLDVDELEEFADEMARMQPLIGELARDPSLGTLAEVIELGLEELEPGDPDEEELWASVLDRVSRSIETMSGPRPATVSWETLLLEGSGIAPPALRVIVADPILDLSRVLAAEDGIRTVRETADSLGLSPERGVRVRITGYPALNHEEMIGLATDTAWAGLLSFVLVVVVLSWSFRSSAMVLAAAGTLVVGLVWSAAFAGAAVAVLNPLSITFGVLVIGLGIDFMIHLGMHFADGIRNGEDVGGALQWAVQETGSALLLCGVTTTVGFLAFVPTDYRGVSDLGLLASGGVLILLFQTLTLMPALLRLGLGERGRVRLAASSTRGALWLPEATRPALVCSVALAAAALAVPSLSRVDLDTNVIRMRNPDTESVRAFEDLLADRDATPWYLDALTPSLEAADTLAETLRDQPGVDRVVTLSDFVPEEQDDKLAILDDVTMFLGLSDVEDLPDGADGEARDALRDLLRTLDAELASKTADDPLAGPIARLVTALRDLLSREDAHLDRLQVALLGTLPDQLRRLEEGLAAEPVDRDALPGALVSRMVADDGQARVQVYPSEDLWENAAMIRFVEGIRPFESSITGLPVNLVESAEATWTSLLQAMLWATGAITLLLLVLWRRLGDTLIAMGPLLLAVGLTQVSTLVLPVAFTFANVMVLPLLLGIGIDGAIHLVHRARHHHDHAELRRSTTTRAVWFSALTTIASFGTLVISGHRGVASLGFLLVVGMLWVLLANLVLLPALLVLRGERPAAG